MRYYDQSLPKVAYFCMEYGLHEEFEIYAGGLGILAGDHMKSAGDLKVPLVGIGLMWRHGYTTQCIGSDGRPCDDYPINKYDFLIDTEVTVPVEIRGRQVMCKVWKVDKYGNAPLYLLDTDIPGNEDRWITGKLYGGYSETRIAQEMVLGIGGIRALRALGLDIDVYHFNEGHAVFAGIELIREKMAQGYNFETAWDLIRRHIVFTTHTPVPAGNEAHDLDALGHMGAFNGLNREQMQQLGGDPFGMTVAALRMARMGNAVAQLHGHTARRMWKDVHGAASIMSITNGVHTRTWWDTRVREAYKTGQDLWEPHMAAKMDLIHEIEARNKIRLNPDALLIGFARRAAPYKRSDFIFRKPEMIEPMLHEGKLQMVFAGKAHPNDDMGKSIIANLYAASQRYPNSVVFLENYDMQLGRLMTSGADVWLNNPRRPQEASGTSGMKAAMNGVLNMSTLDGWWPEGCEHGVTGWQIGDAYEGPDQDHHDLQALYQVLFNEVIPTFYENRTRWTQMMRASIDMSHHKFSAERMVQEYYGRLYTMAEEAWAETAAGK